MQRIELAKEIVRLWWDEHDRRQASIIQHKINYLDGKMKALDEEADFIFGADRKESEAKK